MVLLGSARADLVVVEYHCRLRCAATGDFSTLFSGGGRAAGGAFRCWETCARLFSRRGSGWCVVARRFGTAVSFPRWTAGILYTDGCCWERDGAMRRQRLFFSVRRFRGAWRVTLGWLARLRLPYGAVRLPPGSGRVAECGRFAQGCAMGRVTCVAGPISSCPSACRAHACAEYVAVSAVQREGMWAFVRALRV